MNGDGGRFGSRSGLLAVAMGRGNGGRLFDLSTLFCTAASGPAWPLVWLSKEAYVPTPSSYMVLLLLLVAIAMQCFLAAVKAAAAF